MLIVVNMNDNNETYGELLHALDPQTRQEYRTLEKIKKKLISRKYAGVYNNVCLNNKLFKYGSTTECFFVILGFLFNAC